jgi:PLP dependent protein
VTEPDSARLAELAAALAQVRLRIESACRQSGRTVAEVELIAVTKNRSARDVALLLDLGLQVFGENRPQEASAKLGRLGELRPGAASDWHLIGTLQRNKARAVAQWAARVESVDSPRLADALDVAARRAADEGTRQGPLPVLIQVSLDGDPGRGGVPLVGLDQLADQVERAAALRLDGLMAVAPLGAERDHGFGTLAEVSARLCSRLPHARVISAGMTSDLELAIRYGSTCVRVGTALLGDRRLTSR